MICFLSSCPLQLYACRRVFFLQVCFTCSSVLYVCDRCPAGTTTDGHTLNLRHSLTQPHTHTFSDPSNTPCLHTQTRPDCSCCHADATPEHTLMLSLADWIRPVSQSKFTFCMLEGMSTECNNNGK